MIFGGIESELNLIHALTAEFFATMPRDCPAQAILQGDG